MDLFSVILSIIHDTVLHEHFLGELLGVVALLQCVKVGIIPSLLLESVRIRQHFRVVLLALYRFHGGHTFLCFLDKGILREADPVLLLTHN